MANSKAIGVAYSDQTINGGDTLLAASSIGYVGTITSVTQATDKGTGVTINTPAGQIVTNNASLAAATEVAFIVTCSSCLTYDVPVVALKSGATTAGTYGVTIAAVGAGSFTIVITNLSAGSLSEALTLNYAIIRNTAT